MSDGRMIMAQMAAQRWALHRPVLQAGIDILSARGLSERVALDRIAEVTDRRDARQSRRRIEWGDEAHASELESRGYFIDGSVAVVPVQGLICKYSSMINGISQPEGMTTASICRILQAAAGEVRPGGRVQSVLIDIDSPGGTVAGIHDVQACMAEIRGRGVRMVGLCHDMAASGGYWLGSQCTSLYCTPQADVGSIGVFSVVEDSSKLYTENGVTRYLIASGEHKGTGTPGTEVTEAQLIQQFAEVRAANEVFIAAVAEGRGMSIEQVREVATGKTLIGQQAVDAGLCDKVAGYAELLAMMNEHAAAA